MRGAVHVPTHPREDRHPWRRALCGHPTKHPACVGVPPSRARCRKARAFAPAARRRLEWRMRTSRHAPGAGNCYLVATSSSSLASLTWQRVEEVRAALDSVIRTKRSITLDLRGLEFIDSTRLHLVVE